MVGITPEDLRIDGNTILANAVSNDHVNVIDYLRQNGLTLADARSRNNGLLRMAVYNSSIPTIEALHRFGLTYEDLTAGVPSILTLAQEHGNPVVLAALEEWNDQDNCVGLQNNECAICTDKLIKRNAIGRAKATTLLRTPCKHLFHADELLNWVRVSTERIPSCPFDRRPLLTNGRVVDMMELRIEENSDFNEACRRVVELMQR